VRHAGRILFLDDDQPHTLHMAGALIRHGYQTDILSAVPHPRPPYDGGALRVMTAPPSDQGQYLETVDAVVARGSYQHIIPMSDTTLRCAHLENRNWTTYVFPRVARDRVELLLDKRRTCEFAEGLGVLTPEIRSLDGVDALSRAARDLGFPLVVKGVSGEGGGVNVSIVRSFREAEDAIRVTRGRTKQEPYLQQYVEGMPYLVGGLFAEGAPLRLFAAHITQQSPERTGPAVRLRSSGDAELMDSFCAIMKAVEWTGFAQGDYVRDERGRFAFLEVNPRPWGSIAAAARVGVDFFTPLVQLFHGETPDARLGFPSGRDIALFPQRVRAHLRSSRPFVSRWLAALSDLASWSAVWHTDLRLIHPYLRWMIYRRREIAHRPELPAQPHVPLPYEPGA
jgi:predicted ATP-grasp superfamily ATP-dependent carboligase